MNRFVGIAVLSLFVAFAVAGVANAQTSANWGVATGDMNVGSNWGLGGVVPNYDAIINNGGTATLSADYVAGPIQGWLEIGARSAGGGTIGGGTLNHAAGTLTIAGDSATNYKGALLIANDEDFGVGGTSVATSYYNMSGTAVLELDTPVYNHYRGWVGIGAGGGKGVMTVAGDAQVVIGDTTGTVNFLIGATSAGALYQSGGTIDLAHTVSGAVVHPRFVNFGWASADCDAYYQLTGGSMTIAGEEAYTTTGALEGWHDPTFGNWAPCVIDISGTGELNVFGANVYCQNAGPDAKGAINVSGGGHFHTWEVPDREATPQILSTGFSLAGNASGTLNVGDGGTVEIENSFGLYLCAGDSGQQGVINLGSVGGDGSAVLRVASTFKLDPAAETNNAIFNFHGGTLKAVESRADFMQQYDEVVVYSEGAVIDTDGNDVTITQDLVAPTGEGVQSISLASGGTGYIGAPTVEILGDGTGATGKAIFDKTTGTVTGIEITNPGSGYSGGGSFLTINLHGGAPDVEAVVGSATVVNNVATGGLTKTGAGKLTLIGNATYEGMTTVEEGTLAVSGSLLGDVVVDSGAALAPGASIGNLSIGGDLTLDGELIVEYGDNTTDFLDVLGGLDLSGGTIRFTPMDEGTLDLGTYVFATSADLSGGPATELGLLPGWSVVYDYDANSISLIVAEATLIPGDTNGDSIVNATDAQVLAAHWGESVPAGEYQSGDFNGDGLVNAADASILAANWGSHAEGAAQQSVPEPGLSLLTLLLVAVLGARVRRSRG